jgi:hypothetical protein
MLQSSIPRQLLTRFKRAYAYIFLPHNMRDQRAELGGSNQLENNPIPLISNILQQVINDITGTARARALIADTWTPQHQYYR